MITVIGAPLALAEVKVFLGMVVRHFDLELLDDSAEWKTQALLLQRQSLHGMICLQSFMLHHNMKCSINYCKVITRSICLLRSFPSRLR